MRDPAGAVAGRIFAFRDISAERVVEQMKSDFVSTVSHELRTPLTSIYGFARRCSARTSASATRSARRSSATSRRVRAPHRDRRRAAERRAARHRRRSGRRSTPTDVGARSSRGGLEPRRPALANGHRFVSTSTTACGRPGRPGQAAPGRRPARRERRQVLAGGRHVVRLEARRRPDAVEITVADEGIGIPQSEQRADLRRSSTAASETQPGTGLGLFIAQGLVSAMGGRIWVRLGGRRGLEVHVRAPGGTEE